MMKHCILENADGMQVEIIAQGATLRRWTLPVGESRRDILLGHESMDAYRDNPGYLGAVVGRVANRIGGARFTLDGRSYAVPCNDGRNSLHGGGAFSHRAFTLECADASHAVWTLESPDGEAGYPGKVFLRVSYTLGKNFLRLDYEGTTDAPTLLNCTNHAYFNLNGCGSGDVLDHVFELASDFYTPSDDELIPTGEVLRTAGTPFDLKKGRTLRECVQAGLDKGFDNNFVLNAMPGPEPHFAARVSCPGSNLILTCETTSRGLQLYTGNFLNATTVLKGGIPACRFGGFCLETQDFPDAANRPQFPSIVLRQGETYRRTTLYRLEESDSTRN